MALYAEADPMSAGSVDRRRLLAEALAELVADGLVKRAARQTTTGSRRYRGTSTG